MSQFRDKDDNVHQMAFCKTPNCGNVATHISWAHQKEDDPMGSMLGEPTAVCEVCATEFVGRIDMLKRNPEYKKAEIHPAVVRISEVMKHSRATDEHIAKRLQEQNDGKERNSSGNFRGMHMKDKQIWDTGKNPDGSTRSSLIYLKQRRTEAQRDALLQKAIHKLKHEDPEVDKARKKHMEALTAMNNTLMDNVSRMDEFYGRWWRPEKIKPYYQKPNEQRGTAFNPQAEKDKPNKTRKGGTRSRKKKDN